MKPRKTKKNTCIFIFSILSEYQNFEEKPLPKKKSKSVLQNGNPQKTRTSIIFTLKNEVGGLAKVLQVFQELGINVLHLELRPATNSEQGDVLIDIDCEARHLDHVLRILRREVKSVNYAQCQQNYEEYPPPTPLSQTGSFGNYFMFTFKCLNQQLCHGLSSDKSYSP